VRRAIAASAEDDKQQAPAPAPGHDMAAKMQDVRAAVDRSATRASTEGAHYMTNVRTALVFNPYRDEGMRKSYADEGDPEMDSEENEAKRLSLRTHPAVRDAITRMMALYKRDVQGVLKDEYFSKYLLIVRLLMPKMSAAEAREEAEVDWAEDAEDGSHISVEGLETGLFQLADMWCKSVQVSEYVAFLDTLAQRVAAQTTADRAATTQ